MSYEIKDQLKVASIGNGTLYESVTNDTGRYEQKINESWTTFAQFSKTHWSF